jgi:hypothetical protein
VVRKGVATSTTLIGGGGPRTTGVNRVDTILEILEDLFYGKRFSLLIVKVALSQELSLHSDVVLTS